MPDLTANQEMIDKSMNDLTNFIEKEEALQKIASEPASTFM